MLNDTPTINTDTVIPSIDLNYTKPSKGVIYQKLQLHKHKVLVWTNSELNLYNSRRTRRRKERGPKDKFGKGHEDRGSGPSV